MADTGDRRNPHRGRMIKPLPRYMHPEFRRFMADLRTYTDRQWSTWKLAARELGPEAVAREIADWKAIRRFMNTVEYLGTQTHGDPDPT